MKAKGPTRFDLVAIRRRAGAKTFERGKEYFDDDCVEILSLEPKRVVAQVAGTEDYRTVVTADGKEISGECSCPAFGDFGFCKHMVAAALAANAAGDDSEAASAVPRVREHLQAKSKDQLVDMVLELAELQPELLRKLNTQTVMSSADDATIERRLKADIEKATRVDYYLDYQRAKRWQTEVDAVLTAVADIATGPRAALALKLLDHAIERIGGVFESIDDSDGHLGALLARASEIHLEAARAAKPEPVAFARDLFKREVEDDFGIFSGAVTDYADVLGEQGLAEYRRLATAAWEKLAIGRHRKDRNDGFGSRLQLTAILDFFAERDGDVETRIALRAKDLSSQWAYLQLAEFCLSQGRRDEALKRAEQGLWLFEDDRSDKRLLFFTVGLLIKLDRKADAETYLWRAFEKAPSFAIYKELRRNGGEAAAERALAFLQSRAGRAKRDPWDASRNLLVEALLHEKRFEAAWAIVREFQISLDLKERLVKLTETEYRADALAFYAARIEQLANSSAYEEAMKLVRRMAKLQSSGDHAAFVSELKERHRRKRNFMKLLG
jgi:uncharacterized Zn finger protein